MDSPYIVHGARTILESKSWAFVGARRKEIRNSSATTQNEDANQAFSRP